MAIKVCHMTSTHPPKDQRIFYKQCVSLAKAGYDVYLVEQGKTEEVAGVQIVGTQEENKGRFYRLLKRPRQVYKLAKALDADIYQFHDMELLPYGMKLKRQGKKVVFDYHEDYATRFADSDALPGPKWAKDLIAKLYCWYERRSVQRLDAMISVTPHICERLAKSNPNTVMVTNYPLLDADTWKQETQYNKDSMYVAFAGQVSETYRLAFITRALQSIKDIEFQICGPQRKSDDLEKIQAEDAAHIVNYLGVLPYMEIPAFFSNSRATVVVPGYNSNSGGTIGTLGCNKIYESMLCGVPVICTDYELWKDMINEHRCGICVNPYDEKQLADAVQYILDHPAEAEEMGKNGRKAVLEAYNWNTQERVLLDLYKNIV
jgi:glycosyltransferase involved in cell wall biosynthesis